MDGGAWWAAVHGVAKSRTRLSDFTFPFHFHELEKEMATHSSVLAWIDSWSGKIPHVTGQLNMLTTLPGAHSSVLAWRVPGTAEPGGLPSLGSHRVGHD